MLEELRALLEETVPAGYLKVRSPPRRTPRLDETVPAGYLKVGRRLRSKSVARGWTRPSRPGI